MRKAIIILLVLILPYTVVSNASAKDIPNINPEIASTAQATGITIGAHIRPAVNYGDALTAFNTSAGKPIGILMYFLDWRGVPNSSQVFDPYLLDTLHKTISPTNFPTIMLTWQPMNGKASEGCDKDYGTSMPLSAITQGKCDSYIRTFATELSARSERFLLRFAHEMNITDSAWWPGNYGQDASAYVAMWKHVHDIVASVQNSAGKHNIEWVWSTNYASNPPDSWNAIPNYYPGNSYVDWIGLSGYNWYNSPGHVTPWKSFSTLYDSVLKDLACRYPKPQILTEIGTAGSTSEKAGWIQDAFSRIGQYPFVRAIVWFNDFAYESTSQADFRVINSPYLSSNPVSLQVTSAFQSAVSSNNFVTAFPTLSSATPPLSNCAYLNLTRRAFVPLIKK